MTGSGKALLGTFTLPVEPVKVTEFARSVRWDGPGVPPTFTAVAAHYAPPGRSANELIIEAAGLDRRQVLLGSMSWAYSWPLEAGDQLTGAVTLDGCRITTSGSGRELRIATGQTRWTDASGRLVVTVAVTLIEPSQIEPSRAGTAATATPPAPTGVSADVRASGDVLTISRTDIVRYAGAAGDFNPVHHDAVAARALGYPDVFAMGLLPAGILASMAARSGGQLLAVAARFRGQVWPDVPYAVRSTGSDELALTMLDPQATTVLELTATRRRA
jgi:acyl dehydratase